MPPSYTKNVGLAFMKDALQSVPILVVEALLLLPPLDKRHKVQDGPLELAAEEPEWQRGPSLCQSERVMRASYSGFCKLESIPWVSL